ncbi:hypothetical protein BURKHO8Y_520049 [Burkholderia sp. 8Y]|nr:hypothetical protein BURKHO8Y_520049 [Burkholderia sp. 8Y]
MRNGRVRCIIFVVLCQATSDCRSPASAATIARHRQREYALERLTRKAKVNTVGLLTADMVLSGRTHSRFRAIAFGRRPHQGTPAINRVQTVAFLERSGATITDG